MLNEDLLDPKDKEIVTLKLKIANLKKAIDKFKKYDKERKEYYRNALVELGELKEFIEADNIAYPLLKKLKNYKKMIKEMSTNIYYGKAIEAGVTLDEVDSRKAQIAILGKQISDLKKENEKYFLEIVQLKKALNDQVNK
ncbi:hypothetical protein [Intestinibacter sp.]|uniref:hypothetical protein n=1 Tax=Intestinibacter sp. TaxID=1965304 RepID=UPI003F13EF56